MIKATNRRSEFGQRIKDLRANNSLTAAELARLTDVTPAAVWQWEKKGTQPRRGVIEKIARHFGLRVSDLTGETSAPAIEPPDIQPQPLTEYPLEDLLKAIERKGYRITLKTRAP